MLYKWIRHNLLGEPEPPKEELAQNQEEVTQELNQEADKNPAASNSPEQGNAVVKATKGEFNDALVKMTAWHEGKRKQNVTACSPKKLQIYYKVCAQLGFDTEAKILADEMAKKGVALPSLNESLQDLLFPGQSIMPLYEYLT